MLEQRLTDIIGWIKIIEVKINIMKKSKITALFAILVFALIFSAGCGDAAVIARVNGEKILQSELDDKIAEIKMGLTSQGYSFEEEKDKEILGQIEEEAMNQLIDEALLMQQASKEGVAVENSAVQEQMKLLKQQFGNEVFKQLLAQQQMTETKLAKQIEVQLTAEALFNKITGDISLGNEEVQTYYNDNTTKFEQVKVAHILILADADSAPDKAETAQKKANDLIAKLKSGADFSELAKNNSEDGQSAESGGVIDYYFTREDTSLVKEFVDGAFVVGEGQFSQTPVRSPYGFHIIKVLDKKDTYAELKSSLEQQLLSDKKNKAFSEFFNKAKSEAKIENLLKK